MRRVAGRRDKTRVVRISLDVMGGDYGPEVVIPGAARALERHPDIKFVLFGQEARCAELLAKYPNASGKQHLL
ncbi:fatty acid/phospholipid biosynthesis enzyme [Sinorhizobium fredii]